jgi:hypothetical protein
MTALGLPWTAPTVSSVESGRRVVSVAELVGLCSVFGEPVGAFMDADDAARLMKGTRRRVDRSVVDEAQRDARERRLTVHIASRLAVTEDEVRRLCGVVYGSGPLAAREGLAAGARPHESGLRGQATRTLIGALRTAMDEEAI